MSYQIMMMILWLWCRLLDFSKGFKAGQVQLRRFAILVKSSCYTLSCLEKSQYVFIFGDEVVKLMFVLDFHAKFS